MKLEMQKKYAAKWKKYVTTSSIIIDKYNALLTEENDKLQV